MRLCVQVSCARGNRGFDKVGILVIGRWPGFSETLRFDTLTMCIGKILSDVFGVADFEQDLTCWNKRKLPR